MPRCTLGLLPRLDLDDLDQVATWTCGMNTAARRARELAATGEGIARDGRRNCARKRKHPRERIFCEDERFPDKNSWVHYFGKCQVKNDKYLEMNLFFLWQNVGDDKHLDLANSNKWQIPIA